MQPSPRTRFYLINLGLPLLLAALVFVLFDLTSLDQSISNLLLDPVSGQFPLLHDQWFEKVSHKWPRILPDWTGEAAIVGLLLSFIWPRLTASPKRLLEATGAAPLLRFTRDHRQDLLFVVVAFALSTTVIHYLKSHTGVYCPVETTLYGGTHLRQEWFSNFNWTEKTAGGRCWPGGHASSGFTLLALYFVALRHQWRHARLLLVGIVLLGLVYGTTRVLQGWHFMSHTFWAGIFVWLTTWLTALFCYGRPALQGLPVLTPTPRLARLPALSGWHKASRVIDTRLMRFKHKGQQ